jgi:predicted nucleic acid-binding protein
MIVVIDANAGLEVALNREDGERFKAILADSDLVIAPDTYPSEITNAAWKYRVFSNVDQERCEEVIDYCLDLVDDYIDTRGFCREVFAESARTRHPAYYLFYLVLARRNGASLLTRDRKMATIAKELNIDVIGSKS